MPTSSRVAEAPVKWPGGGAPPGMEAVEMLRWKDVERGEAIGKAGVCGVASIFSFGVEEVGGPG